eukprot:2796065-Pyramimonas_sp.AAC.1
MHRGLQDVPDGFVGWYAEAADSASRSDASAEDGPEEQRGPQRATLAHFKKRFRKTARGHPRPRSLVVVLE